MPSLESASSSAKPKPQSRNNTGGRRRLLRIFGHSMSPLLNPGEMVVVVEGEFDSRPPRRDEIVAARPASLGGQAFVKRIAGLPSERVTVDGKEWQLSDDEFFLLGDHAEHSLDSRAFGPVRREELIGPVQMRLWPWTVFDRDSPPA